MSLPKQLPVYRFGKWEIDLTLRELRANGTSIPVRGLAFEIIEVLVRAAGELVNKHDLADRIWPGVIVGDNTLYVHISEIRKALGPDRAMLKTISGRGYQLLGTWTCRKVSETNLADCESTRVSAESSLTNLPAAVDDLIGRADAVSQLIDLMSENRVVTLTGPGGIGKTVLALEVARRLLPDFEGHCWMIGLASISDPSLVPTAVGDALGLKWGGDAISPAAVAKAIRATRVLLILDNCEHVVDAAADLAETVLRTCPRASILSTSREALRIGGEYVYRVGPLDVPPKEQTAPAEVMGHSAVQLFVSRARALREDFCPHQEGLVPIAAISRRLDGIPLAIELAAARAASFGPQLTASLLDDRFRLLTGGLRTALPRHQALRATLDWSYELLSESERRLLRQLAIFAGVFSIDEACALITPSAPVEIALLDDIANLVAKSLVTADFGGTAVRYRLLETTRKRPTLAPGDVAGYAALR